MEDQLYYQLVRIYIATQQKYRRCIYDPPPEKRVESNSLFRQAVRPYRTAGRVLYHGNKEVCTKSRLQTILEICHGNLISGGPFGREKKFANISERYYW